MLIYEGKAFVMRIKGRVHYVSAKGSAEMVAEVIAREMKVVKEPLLPAYMPENIALMFLGCEGTKADKTTMSFINSLNKSRVANAALFCCNSKKSDAAIQQMAAALKEHGINVLPKTLITNGKGGLFGGKHPSEQELQQARDFANECEKLVLGE